MEYNACKKSSLYLVIIFVFQSIHVKSSDVPREDYGLKSSSNTPLWNKQTRQAGKKEVRFGDSTIFMASVNQVYPN